MNIKKIRRWCIKGIKYCIYSFICWIILGYLFNQFKTTNWNKLQNNWVISELIIFGIIISFMYMVYKYMKEDYNFDYKVKNQGEK